MCICSWPHPACTSSTKDTNLLGQLCTCRRGHLWHCGLWLTDPTKPTGQCGCWWPEVTGWWRPSKSQGRSRAVGRPHLHDAVETRLRLLRYSFFTSISLRIFSLLDRHSRYFSAGSLREDRVLSWDAPLGTHQHTYSPLDSTLMTTVMWWTAMLT